MRKVVRLVVLLLVFILLSLPLVAAHVAHAEPSVEGTSFWYRVFEAHDYLHPVFFILMIVSCYYFRFFWGRNISGEPRSCEGACKGCYSGEGWLKQQHRYFFWGTFLLAFIHIGELVPSFRVFSMLPLIEVWILVFEASYLGFAFLYLFTCYHFRYVIERAAHRRWLSYRIYNKLTAFNRHHNIFFWLTILAVAVRFTLVAVDTGSILQAIPGTF